ncbi:unnamed protein product, partial [Sphacelaria rigidula]
LFVFFFFIPQVPPVFLYFFISMSCTHVSCFLVKPATSVGPEWYNCRVELNSTFYSITSSTNFSTPHHITALVFHVSTIARRSMADQSHEKERKQKKRYFTHGETLDAELP